MMPPSSEAVMPVLLTANCKAVSAIEPPWHGCHKQQMTLAGFAAKVKGKLPRIRGGPYCNGVSGGSCIHKSWGHNPATGTDTETDTLVVDANGVEPHQGATLQGHPCSHPQSSEAEN